MGEIGSEIPGAVGTPQPGKESSPSLLAKVPFFGRFFAKHDETIQSGISTPAPAIADKMTSSADAAGLGTDATQGSQDIGIGHAVSPSSSVDNVVNDTMASIDQQMSASDSTTDIAAGMAAHANNPGVMMRPPTGETIAPAASAVEEPAA